APAVDDVDMAGVAGHHPERVRHRFADRRLADPGPGDDRLMAPDQHARGPAIRSARPQFERGPRADQLAPRIVVLRAEQGTHRYVDKIGVAVPGLAVGEGELGAFDDGMDEVGTERIEIVEIEAL